MNYQNILSKTKDGITTITINRPSKLNALNRETIEELRDAFEEADNSTKTKVIIVTGSGEKAFVAGADISEFADFSVKEGGKLAEKGQELLFDFVANLSTPVIAAVNGLARGDVLKLDMASHFLISTNNAKMGYPEVSLDVIPYYDLTQRLPQMVSKGSEMEMIMTAAKIDTNQDWHLSCRQS